MLRAPPAHIRRARRSCHSASSACTPAVRSSDPRRVSAALVAALRAEKAVFVVVHANHRAAKLTQASRAACGISSSRHPCSARPCCSGDQRRSRHPDALMRGLAPCGSAILIAPRRPCPRHAHFRTTIAAGQAIQRAMRFHASGLCQPAYVLDLPGGDGKVAIRPVLPDACPMGAGWSEGHDGARHAYLPRERE